MWQMGWFDTNTSLLHWSFENLVFVKSLHGSLMSNWGAVQKQAQTKPPNIV